jgi:hypothetical protein
VTASPLGLGRKRAPFALNDPGSGETFARVSGPRSRPKPRPPQTRDFGDAITAADIYLTIVAETAFTNTLFVVMPSEAAANGDYLLPTVFHSVQSDESRHISNGYSIIVMALSDERTAARRGSARHGLEPGHELQLRGPYGVFILREIGSGHADLDPAGAGGCLRRR